MTAMVETYGYWELTCVLEAIRRAVWSSSGYRMMKPSEVSLRVTTS